jgi:hypothetical protein
MRNAYQILFGKPELFFEDADVNNYLKETGCRCVN